MEARQRIIALLSLCSVLGAQAASETTTAAVPAAPAPVAAPAAKSASAPTLSLDDWATGMALIKPRRRGVNDASIAGNVVRVNSSAQYEATILVARHFYPFRKGSGKCHMSDVAKPAEGDFLTECMGGMVAAGISSGSGGSGSGQVINFLGIGITVGGGVGNDPTTAWHAGLGYGRRFNYKVLGDGFTENQAPPAGETQIRYKTIDVGAPFAFFTAHW